VSLAIGLASPSKPLGCGVLVLLTIVGLIYGNYILSHTNPENLNSTSSIVVVIIPIYLFVGGLIGWGIAHFLRNRR